MRTAAGADLVPRHLFEAYGRSPLVWLGILFTALSHLIYKIAAPIVMTAWVVGLLIGASSPTADLWRLAVLYGAGMVLGVLGDYIFIRQSDGRYASLVGRFHDGIVARPVNFFRKKEAGALGALFRNHMDGTINLVRFIRVDILPLLIATVGPLAVLAPRDPKVAAVFAAGVLLHAYLTWRGSKKLKPLRSAATKVYADLSGVMGDQMAHLTVLRASGDIASQRAKLVRLAAEEGRLFWNRHRLAMAYGLAGNAITAGCFIGVLALIAVSGLGNEDRLELAILTMIFIVQGMQAAGTVVELHQRWSARWEHTASSLRELGDPGPCVANDLARSTPPATGEVAFRGVSFAYPGAEPRRFIFQDLDLSIPDGRHVAMIGRNGAGKSTLVNLLLHFDSPASGSVELDGRSLDSYRDDQFYRSVSYVPQDPKLFNLTVRENVFFFESGAPRERVTAAFDAVGMDDMIAKLDGGLEASAGEMGALLSGGQRQRVAIARALLRDARVYIFDEATSGLDPDDAKQVLRKTLSLLKGRTVIFITHSREMTEAFEHVIDVARAGVRWIRGGAPAMKNSPGGARR